MVKFVERESGEVEVQKGLQMEGWCGEGKSSNGMARKHFKVAGFLREKIGGSGLGVKAWGEWGRKRVNLW